MKVRGAANATPGQKARFRAYREQGYSVKKAAEKVGMSPSWGYGQVEKDKKLAIVAKAHDPPAPKRLDELDGGVKDCLHDYGLFETTFLGFRSTPWRRDAAMRVAAMLVDTSRRDYVDINTPPGVGKTALFTFGIPLWLMCGGAAGDPAWGRAIRIMLGSETKNVAEHYVLRLRRLLESPRAYSYYDKSLRERVSAELSVLKEFGRFKPQQGLGEPSVWKANEFTVAQLMDVDIVEKEPTVQAASRESGFLGERIDYYSWDDLVTRKNSQTAEVSENLATWFGDESETRLEPGGVGALVGQRLGPLDLHRNRLEQMVPTEDGEEPKYKHIIYPAHFEHLCDGSHRQWDGASDGCLLDEPRLSWGDLLAKQSEPNYRTVYQQEDTDPSRVLVFEAWLVGGTDPEGYPAPGCYDDERGFYEWPDLRGLVDYVTVDPSVENFWAIEWKAVDPATMRRYLIYGERRPMQAGAFLDWDPDEEHHVGIMEELQVRSCELGHPIVMWVVEQNAAHKYLFQYEHYRRWRRKWAKVAVVSHETQRNKADPKFGVQAAVPMPYKKGMVRLPRKHGDLSALNYMRIKTFELTHYPFCRTDDTIMTDWFGEFNMERILAAGAALVADDSDGYGEGLDNLPPYLLAQRKSVPVG